MQTVQSAVIHTPSSDATLMSKGILETALLVNSNIAYYNYILLLQALGAADIKSTSDMYAVVNLTCLLKRAELLAEKIIDSALRPYRSENRALFIEVMQDALAAYTDLHYDSQILGTVSIGDLPGNVFNRVEQYANDTHFQNIREAAVSDYKKLALV